MQYLYELNKGDLFTMEPANGMGGIFRLVRKGYSLYHAERIEGHGTVCISKFKLVERIL